MDASTPAAWVSPLRGGTLGSQPDAHVDTRMAMVADHPTRVEVLLLLRVTTGSRSLQGPDSAQARMGSSEPPRDTPVRRRCSAIVCDSVKDAMRSATVLTTVLSSGLSPRSSW